MATIRFGELVKCSGKPKPKSLWTEPEKDPEFVQAIKQNRVLTVISEGAHKKDFGMIGFRRIPHANYFIFPKALAESSSRVVGIKYDLAENSVAGDAAPIKRLGHMAKPTKSNLKKIAPAEKMFRFRIRTTAIAERVVEVEARNKIAARQKATQLASGQSFDIRGATVKRAIKLLRGGS